MELRDGNKEFSRHPSIENTVVDCMRILSGKAALQSTISPSSLAQAVGNADTSYLGYAMGTALSMNRPQVHNKEIFRAP